MGWQADISAASDFAPPFACASFVPGSSSNANTSEFCNRDVDARARAALADRGSHADLSWQQVYGRLADAAPLVPLINRRAMTLVSKRVGNFQYHPLRGAAARPAVGALGTSKSTSRPLSRGSQLARLQYALAIAEVGSSVWNGACVEGISGQLPPFDAVMAR